MRTCPPCMLDSDVVGKKDHCCSSSIRTRSRSGLLEVSSPRSPELYLRACTAGASKRELAWDMVWGVTQLPILKPGLMLLTVASSRGQVQLRPSPSSNCRDPSALNRLFYERKAVTRRGLSIFSCTTFQVEQTLSPVDPQQSQSSPRESHFSLLLLELSFPICTVG